jgi:hypothetical protein
MLLLLSLVAIAVSGGSLDHVSYVDLALQKCTRTDRYTIHGLWPEYNQTSYPQFCNKTKCQQFNVSELNSIRGQLNLNWPSCQQSNGDDGGLGWNTMIFPLSNDSFYKHEYCKHGACIDDITVLNYFKRTLRAYREAYDNDWYGCCSTGSKWNECLIPFSKNISEVRWLGYCH